jgi:tetratricopeptide (TPR) repeat protein
VTTRSLPRPALGAALAAATTLLLATGLTAQQRGGSEIMRQAAELDRSGETTRARELYQSVLDTASDPGTQAAVRRSIAMSYAFDGDCANTVKYEEMVIDYWKTQEEADPQNAFYQEGEMADEAARVCVDAGDLDTGERMYRRGYELGTKEPEPRTHPVSLWDFRLAHALGRIAARRGDAEEAHRQVMKARQALDGDPDMAQQQERFFPYLTGYVQLYLGNLDEAQADLERAVAIRGNDRDPFMHTLLAMTYEKQGKQAQADEMYRKAYDLARAHNPPAAYVRRVVGEKLGMGGGA